MAGPEVRARPRSVSRALWIAGLAAVCALATGMPSAAADRVSENVPDAEKLAWLRGRLEAERVVRLVGEFGTRDVRQPVVDASGVRSGSLVSRAGRRPGLFMAHDAVQEQLPAPISWDRIEAVQVGGTYTGRGTVAGLLVGIVVGSALASSQVGRFQGEGHTSRAGTLFIGSVMAGAIAGGVIGSKHGWRTIYHRPHRGSI